MSSFHERLYGSTSQNLFAPLIPLITQISDILVKDFKSKFSDGRYTTPKNLNVQWVASFDFQASASVSQTDENQHTITIFYGAPISIYKDAVLFPQMCRQHFSSEKYNELFTLLDYGNGPENVMPINLNDEDAKLEFFNTSLGWLYLHEQAHLFQNHGIILAAELGAEANNNQFAWEEFLSNSSEPVVGKEAWIRHSFEISADYEATNLIIQYLLIKDDQSLKKSTLWLLIAGLTCMFHRFYGKERPIHAGIAIGTHPDPAYRMQYTFTNIIQTLTHQKVQQYVPWAQSAEDLQKVMLHAFNTANMYMQIAHFEQPGLPQFMSRTFDHSKETKNYQSNISSTWNSLHPKVMQKHFGWGPGSVMSFA